MPVECVETDQRNDRICQIRRPATRGVLLEDVGAGLIVKQTKHEECRGSESVRGTVDRLGRARLPCIPPGIKHRGKPGVTAASMLLFLLEGSLLQGQFDRRKCLGGSRSLFAVGSASLTSQIQADA
jgi:hypothetical protein